MAASSKHPLDINLWILKVIESCETRQHFKAAQKLCDLYLNRYPNELNVYCILINAIDKKFYEINYGKEKN